MNDRGFSLVEAVVAILVLAVGVVALGASAGAVTRMTTLGNRTAGAAAVAASRIEVLRATPCATMAGGTATTGKFTESWTVTSVGTLLRAVTVTVSYSTGSTTRPASFTTQISCAAQVQ